MDVEKVLELLEQALEFQEWSKVEEVTEMIRMEYEGPFTEYENDQDLSDDADKLWG